MSLYDVIFDGSVEDIKHLLLNGCNPNEINVFGKYPLMASIRRGDAEIVKVLIEAKANVNIGDIDKWSAVHLAVLWEHVDILKLLLQAKAYTSFRLDDGRTPLHIAADSSGGNACLKILLEAGSNYSICDNLGRTALSYAARRCRKYYTELLLDAGTKLVAFDYEKPQSWFSLLISKRKNIKHTIICFIALAKKTKAIHKDLIGKVVSMIWSTRNYEEWGKYNPLEDMISKRNKIKK